MDAEVVVEAAQELVDAMEDNFLNKDPDDAENRRGRRVGEAYKQLKALLASGGEKR